MSQPPRVVTVLRGAELRAAASTPAAAAPVRPTHLPQAASAAGEGDTVYGVPASAVQHCCGRGCRHCRIYWRGKPP